MCSLPSVRPYKTSRKPKTQLREVLYNILPELGTPKKLVARVVTGRKNSPTVVLACRKRRLKWVPGAWGCNWATLSLGDINTETKGGSSPFSSQGWWKSGRLVRQLDIISRRGHSNLNGWGTVTWKATGNHRIIFFPRMCSSLHCMTFPESKSSPIRISGEDYFEGPIIQTGERIVECWNMECQDPMSMWTIWL
jgi:hypothetical protein